MVTSLETLEVDSSRSKCTSTSNLKPYLLSRKVFQRRVDGSEDFYRGWESYKDGFGSPNHELWLGNDKISTITNQRNYQLRIDLVDRNGSPYFAKYDLFRINDVTDNFRLVALGSYTGNAGKKFATI